jgi:uncharacterized phage-associated protein
MEPVAAEVMDVAAAVRDAYGPGPLSWWTLHKLLYYCQGWSLAWTDHPLFKARIEAWKNGPVVARVYRIQKHYPSTETGSSDALTQPQTDIVRRVVAFYGGYTHYELIALTHREPPWRKARGAVPSGKPCTKEVGRDDMRTYFASFLALSRDLDDNVRRTIDVLLSVPEEEADSLASDAGVDFDAELQYLRGRGPDPWPQSPSRH